MLELLQSRLTDAVFHETVNQRQYMVLKAIEEICNLFLIQLSNEHWNEVNASK